jgi:hypothetical protein
VFVAQGRITTKIAKKNYEIHDDRWLTVPTILHQGAFFFGIVALGLTLCLVLAGQPSTDVLQVTKANQAVRLALRHIPKSAHVTKIDTAELMSGADPMDPTLKTWHVQVDATLLAPTKRARVPQSPFRPFTLMLLSMRGRATSTFRNSRSQCVGDRSLSCHSGGKLGKFNAESLLTKSRRARPKMCNDGVVSAENSVRFDCIFRRIKMLYAIL